MLKTLLRLLAAIFMVGQLAACATQPPANSWAPPAPTEIGGQMAAGSETVAASDAQWEALGMKPPPAGFTWKGCRRTHGLLGQSQTPVMEGCELVRSPEAQGGNEYLVTCWQANVFGGGYWRQIELPYRPSAPPPCPQEITPYYGVPYGYGPVPYGYAPYGHSQWRLRIGHAFSMRGGW